MEEAGAVAEEAKAQSAEARSASLSEDYEEFTSSEEEAEGDMFDIDLRENLQKMQQGVRKFGAENYNKFTYFLVTNSFVRRLYPETKAQKPGHDYYSITLSIQVIMCFFIIIFFPSMNAEQTSFLDQVNKNQFSGEMLIILLCLIVVMITERIIYKNKQFREASQTQSQRHKFQNKL